MRQHNANKRKHVISLPDSDREALLQITRQKDLPSLILLRAKLLLLSNEGMTDLDICTTLGICKDMALKIRRKYVVGGMENALYQKKWTWKKNSLPYESVENLSA